MSLKERERERIRRTRQRDVNDDSNADYERSERSKNKENKESKQHLMMVKRRTFAFSWFLAMGIDCWICFARVNLWRLFGRTSSLFAPF